MALLAPRDNLPGTQFEVPPNYDTQASATYLLDASLYWLETQGLFEPEGAVAAALKNYSGLVSLFHDIGVMVKTFAPATRMHILQKEPQALARAKDVILLLDDSYLFQERTQARIRARSPEMEPLLAALRDRDLVYVDAAPLLLLEQQIRQLAAFRHLQPGWNGYQGRAITPQAITAAHRLLALILEQLWFSARNTAFPDVIVPVPDGGVQFEWRRGARELEVGIGPDGALGYLLTEQTGVEETEEEAERVTRTEILGHIASVVLAQ